MDSTVLQRAEEVLNRFGFWVERALIAGWLWPAMTITGAVVVLCASALATPVGEDVSMLGFDLFGVCEWKERTGTPCGSCGMTRSWVWTVRGDVGRAWGYNPSGSVLFMLLTASGLVGVGRLLTGHRGLPWRVVVSVWTAWFGLFLVIWVQRLLAQ